MFISVAGVLISFDTSYVFVVEGGEGASPALWEVHLKRENEASAIVQPCASCSSFGVAGTAPARLASGRSGAGFIEL